jgi:uncharacterized membrane protein YjjP (DUF1212 family)
VRDVVARVGSAMNESGDAVPSITWSLEKILKEQGATDTGLLVLPTAIIVRTGTGAESGVEVGSSVGGSLRFDQIAAVYELVKKLETEPVDPTEANAELDRIPKMPEPFSWPLRVLGHGLLTLGFALLLRVSPAALLLCFGLGVLIGLLKLLRISLLALIFPVLMAFLVTLIVLFAYEHMGLEDPLRVLLPPLVTFLPGAALTMGTIELASNHMMSGSSRLISGVMQLLLLAFGIVAAAGLLGISVDVLEQTPGADLGIWAMVVAVIAYIVGLVLQYSSPLRYLPWMLVILVVAYGGQLIGATLFGAELSAFFGALAMTPLVLFVDRLPHGPSKLITFLPAFWFLVPGSTGLMAIVGGSASGDLGGALGSVAITVIAIALGVLAGTAAFNAAAKGVRHGARIFT